MTTNQRSGDYAVKVGERLRTIRRQQGLSRREVEERSDHEFKVSILGGYERGERAISTPRLQRLAELYGVPVDEVLPPHGRGAMIRTTSRARGRRQRDGGSVTFGLAQLHDLDVPERDVLVSYVEMIQRQRGDFNGRMITIRDEDVRAIGRVLGRDETSMRRRLSELGVRIS